MAHVDTAVSCFFLACVITIQETIFTRYCKLVPNIHMLLRICRENSFVSTDNIINILLYCLLVQTTKGCNHSPSILIARNIVLL